MGRFWSVDFLVDLHVNLTLLLHYEFDAPTACKSTR